MSKSPLKAHPLDNKKMDESQPKQANFGPVLVPGEMIRIALELISDGTSYEGNCKVPCAVIEWMEEELTSVVQKTTDHQEKVIARSIVTDLNVLRLLSCH